MSPKNLKTKQFRAPSAWSWSTVTTVVRPTQQPLNMRPQAPPHAPLRPNNWLVFLYPGSITTRRRPRSQQLWPNENYVAESVNPRRIVARML